MREQQQQEANEERERRRAARKKRAEEDPPQNWEADAAAGRWQDFDRPGRLDEAIFALEAQLEREVAEATVRIGDHERFARLGLGGIARGEGAFIVEGVLGPLAIWFDDERNRRAGEQEKRLVDARRTDDQIPFRSLDAALGFLVRERAIGMGPVNLQLAEDREEDVVARGRAAWQGRLPRASAHVCADCGHTEQRHRAGGACGWARHARGKERARCYCSAFVRPVPAAVGFLPADFMPAKQTRSGNLGSCRGADALLLGVDVLQGVRAARLGRVELELLSLAVIGEPKTHAVGACWCGRNHVAPAEGTATLAFGVEFVRVRPEELAARLSARLGEPGLVSAEQVGWRVAQIREQVTKELATRALVPKPEPKAKRKKTTRAPLDWEGRIA